MQQFIDKLIGKLEEYIETAKAEGDYTYIKPFEIAKNAVNQLAEEYKGGWIPFTTDSELPKEGHRCWLSFTNSVTSYVKSAWYIDGHFEWDNGRRVKDIPLAWKPYEIPQPYKKGE